MPSVRNNHPMEIKKYSHYNYSIYNKSDAISKHEQPQQNLLMEAQKKTQ